MGRALDRDAVERVLARANELQARDASAPTPELGEAAVYEAAQELGLAPEHVRRALLEERASAALPPDAGWRRRLAGPAAVTVSRILRGDAAGTLAALEQWMDHDECLGVRRRHARELIWEPRQDWWAKTRRTLSFDGRKFHLSRARSVQATVADDGDGWVCVRLTADIGNHRFERLATGGSVAAVGAAAGGTSAVLGVDLPLDALMAAAGAGAGAAVARSHASYAAKATDALDRILDRVESRDEVAPSRLASVVSKSLERGLDQLRRSATAHRPPPPPPPPPFRR